MIRDFTFIDILKMLEEKASDSNSDDAEIEYDLNVAHTAQNIEAIYHSSIQRLAQVSYTLDSILTIEENSIKPEVNGDYADVKARFYNYDKLSAEETNNLNSSLMLWTTNNLMRDMIEFLHFYLLYVYEMAITIKYASQPIHLKDLDNIKFDINKFERESINKRFKLLKRLTGIDIKHRQEVVSIYRARNIFAHFEGIVQEKSCINNDCLEILWPVNDCKLRIRKSGKYIPYRKVKKPFKGDDYDKIKISWLNTPNRSLYKKGDKIKLTAKDTQDLIFFFLSIFNEIQEGLIRYCINMGIPAREFDKYQSNHRFILIAEEPLDEATK